jgi:hypothetical protein
MNLEPFETYIESRFGSQYEYGSWTDELRDVVTAYLAHEVPDELYRPFLDHVGYEVPDGTREEQVAFIVARHEPVDIATGLRSAAVVTAPTFDQLIEYLETVPSAGNWEDAALWLQTHVTEEQITNMVKKSGHAELLRIEDGPGYRPPEAYDLAEVLSLAQLRALWFQATVEVDDPSDSSDISHEVRDWARAKGFTVGNRGRLPAELIEAYQREHGGKERLERKRAA